MVIVRGMARILYYLIFLGVAFLASRSIMVSAECTSGNFQVQWTSSPTTRKPDDVREEMRKLVLAKDEVQQLQTWKAGKRGNGGLASLSCADYVQQNQSALSADSLGEWNWHGATWKSSQFLKDCLGMYLVSRAKPARYDCFGGFQLNLSAASVLPSTLGLIITSVEQRRMSEATSLRTWAPIMKFSIGELGELIGKQEGAGFQEDHFAGIAFGDFDGDGYQDLLLSIQDVSAGSYGELRLAVLSRKSSSGILYHVFAAKNN
jgi:hypothetical protein